MGVTAITVNGQITLSMLFKLSALFHLTCGWFYVIFSLSQRKWMTNVCGRAHTHTHSAYKQTHTSTEICLFKWEVSTCCWSLNRTDLFLPFKLHSYQSCWRIKWSILELATIIKRQCDPQAEWEARMCVCVSILKLWVREDRNSFVFLRWFTWPGIKHNFQFLAMKNTN